MAGRRIHLVGDRVKTITDYAGRHGASLIVFGMKRRSAEYLALLGALPTAFSG